MPLDGSRASGYLTTRSLGVLVALGLLIGIGSWLSDATATTLPLDLTITMSPDTMRHVFGLDSCALGAAGYDVSVLSGSKPGGPEKTLTLDRGIRTSDGGCEFAFALNVRQADRYGIRLNDIRGDVTPTSWVSHSVASRSGADGERLVILVDW